MSKRVLEGLQPERVFYYFEEIAKIPRPSYQEQAISDYLVDFAKAHHLAYQQDDHWNVIMVREASKGYEDEEPIIIQGHMDMVCEKEADCPKDMEKEGLALVVDGDLLSAEGTTLGGDDGIAVAYALALLEDETLRAPRLEFVCTTAEETGMDGAHHIDLSMCRGRRFLNIDSEEEGKILASCAGGGRLGVALPIHRKEQEGNSYTITVDGLQGGHSGNEIHKGRANADMLMARMLRRLSQEKELALLSFAGGEKDNAIPRKAVASVLSDGRAAEVAALVADEEAKVRAIYGTADPDIAIRVTSEQDASLRNAVTAEDTKMIIRLMLSLPNGVVRMSDHIEGLVETSLNLGILQLKEDTLTMTYALRSSVAAAYEALRENMRFMAEGYGAEVEIHSEYPAWEYVADSPLREKMIDIYREQTGKTLVVEAIHAGLECGIFAGKLKGLDAVSFGPDIFDIHTPKERLSISSVERTYRFLRAILEQK